MGLCVAGISGGEAKRLSVAVGLLTHPAILLLDEPTSGLDSRAALGVMRTLHSLVQTQGLLCHSPPSYCAPFSCAHHTPQTLRIISCTTSQAHTNVGYSHKTPRTISHTTSHIADITPPHNASSVAGLTVVCSLHQPRSNIYSLFDTLLLLHRGSTVYFGEAQQLANYLEHELKRPMPSFHVLRESCRLRSRYTLCRSRC